MRSDEVPVLHAAMLRSYRAAVRSVPLVLAAVAALACDNNFEPIDSAGPPFSIFGYVDGTADTQWIRINPSRTSLVGSPEPVGVTATLEQLASGRVIELRDSTVRFGSMIGAPVYAHNFWTAERIEPGASYRFRAQRQDGEVAETVVKIPRDYRLEVWSNAGGQSIWIDELKHIAFLISYDHCPAGPGRHVSTADTGGNPIGRLKGAPGAQPCTVRTRTKLLVEVVGSEVAWPLGVDYSTYRLDAANLPSNITGSIGFIGGVLTKWITIERCTFAYPSTTKTYCKLRYDTTTATLRGRVTSGCVLRADSVNIELRELEGTASDPPRVRAAWRPDGVGEFEIGALRPGVPHRLTISIGDTIGRFFPVPFRIYRDTLTFVAGQTTIYTAAVQPTGTCPNW